MKTLKINIPEGFKIGKFDQNTGEVSFEPLPVDIKERVKSFEDALNIVGASDNMKILLDYDGIEHDLLAAQAFAKMTIIAKALNEGWETDWSDSNQYKYYPCFDMRKSASGGFSYYCCDSWFTYSTVGSRLCFKSRELAEYAGKTFLDIYETLCVIPKKAIS